LDKPIALALDIICDQAQDADVEALASGSYVEPTARPLPIPSVNYFIMLFFIRPTIALELFKSAIVFKSANILFLLL